MIADPRRCDFRPARDLPVCTGSENAECFSSAQVKTLETIYGDLVLNGKTVAPGWPVGAEITGPNGTSGWDGWIVRENGMGQAAQYAESALQYMIFDKPDTAYKITQFNLERDAARFDWVGN